MHTLKCLKHMYKYSKQHNCISLSLRKLRDKNMYMYYVSLLCNNLFLMPFCWFWDEYLSTWIHPRIPGVHQNWNLLVFVPATLLACSRLHSGTAAWPSGDLDLAATCLPTRTSSSSSGFSFLLSKINDRSTMSSNSSSPLSSHSSSKWSQYINYACCNSVFASFLTSKTKSSELITNWMSETCWVWMLSPTIRFVLLCSSITLCSRRYSHNFPS